VLRLSLRDADSPWLPGVEAVTATLPRLSGKDWEAVRRLVASGPPDEEVGLEGYGNGGPQMLPDPVLMERSR
jgi:nitrate reductase delta subunit